MALRSSRDRSGLIDSGVMTWREETRIVLKYKGVTHLLDEVSGIVSDPLIDDSCSFRRL